jgi:hypothetical protein
MFGVNITTRKPRTEDFTTLFPGKTHALEVAGVMMSVKNTRKTEIYLKWRI